jgi:hypothetical protein
MVVPALIVSQFFSIVCCAYLFYTHNETKKELKKFKEKTKKIVLYLEQKIEDIPICSNARRKSEQSEATSDTPEEVKQYIARMLGSEIFNRSIIVKMPNPDEQKEPSNDDLQKALQRAIKSDDYNAVEHIKEMIASREKKK